MFYEPSGSFRMLHFGQSGDFPLVGDWDGDKKSEVGVYRPAQNELLFDTSLDGVADISIELQKDFIGSPLIGDWDGNGTDDPAMLDISGAWQLFRLNGNEISSWTSILFGAIGDIPLAGDWNADGLDTLGNYSSSTGQILLTNENSPQPLSATAVEIQKNLSQIIVADWYGLGKDFLLYVEGDQWFVQPTSDKAKCPNPTPPLILDIGGAVPLGGVWDWVALSGD